MFEFTDQLMNTIKLDKMPKRIISIVPSQSEFLWIIGLRKEIVGITKFCKYPNEMFQKIERIGGTKNLNIDKIRRLKPDLIIGNKEENKKSQINLLQKEFNVWMSDIFDFKDTFNMMYSLGIIFGKEKETQKLISLIELSLLKVKNIFNNQKVAYFIWKKPYMVAANNTYINFILNYLGLKNAFYFLKRYPILDEEKLKQIKIELCFLSSEPFPFKAKHVNEFELIFPNSKIWIVNGEVFSWYGPRLLYLHDHVKQLKKN